MEVENKQSQDSQRNYQDNSQNDLFQNILPFLTIIDTLYILYAFSDFPVL